MMPCRNESATHQIYETAHKIVTLTDYKTLSLEQPHPLDSVKQIIKFINYPESEVQGMPWSPSQRVEIQQQLT